MPLITRRSSTRSLPRTSVGKNGSIFCHCSSFSQNKLLLMISAPQPATQRITIRLSHQEIYWVLALAAVAQTGGNPVDREVDALHDVLVGCAGAVALEELDLNVIERIDI